MKGYKERVQHAPSLEEASKLLAEAAAIPLPKKSLEKVKRVYLRKITRKESSPA